MKHARKKRNGMKRCMPLLPVFLVAVVALILGASVPELWAHGNKKKIELDEAEVFIEYNSTDGDFGIQFFWDGEPWKWMMVKNERRRPVLSVWANKNVKAQGLTEGFFESAEPTLDELSFEEFLDRFPEGEYTFRGRTLERKWLVGEAELTHYIPCPPLVGSIGAPGTLKVAWRPVTTVVDPDQDIPDPEEEGPPECISADDFEIVAYEVVFEMEALVGEGEDEEERVFVDTATLPADATMLSASPEFVIAAADFRAAGKLLVLKLEVIAIEASGNRTITEATLWEAEEEE
ncbi:MAG: hypothetical protein PVI73_05660 [Syntrophobacterales bacterium]|jgi:hypothetical protein